MPSASSGHLAPGFCGGGARLVTQPTMKHTMTSSDSVRGGEARVRRRRKHARADEIRSAALALFVEKGFDATRTEEIADRAGISKGTLYVYYASKEDLLKAAIALPELSLSQSFLERVTHTGDSKDALRRIIAHAWGHLQHEVVGSVLRLAISEVRRFPQIMELWLRRTARPLHSLIAEAIAHGMSRGEFRTVDPDMVAHSLLLPMVMAALCRNLADTHTLADPRLEHEYVPHHVELVLHSLEWPRRQ
jgi:TetR/AcrR family transcriptional regulator